MTEFGPDEEDLNDLDQYTFDEWQDSMISAGTGNESDYTSDDSPDEPSTGFVQHDLPTPTPFGYIVFSSKPVDEE